MVYLIFLLAYLLLFALIVIVAENYGRSAIAWLVLGIILTPIVSLLFLLLSGKKRTNF